MTENKLRGKKVHFKVFEKLSRLNISQIFVSLEGEGINVGETSLYIRLAGCYSAACKFCDTKFSWFTDSQKNLLFNMDNDNPELLINIFKEKSESISTQAPVRRLTITGGEPMHFIEAIPELIKELKTDKYKTINIDLDFLGIESNGNILHDQKNVLKLIQSFNEISKLGVTPHLTISPKIDSEDCYNSQLAQEKINEMYLNVYKNTNTLLSFPVYYKFIWFPSIDEKFKKLNELTSMHIENLINSGQDYHRIFLMPFTPEDPLRTGNEIWEKSKDEAAKHALEIGVRYSPRIHIDRRLD